MIGLKKMYRDELLQVALLLSLLRVDPGWYLEEDLPVPIGVVTGDSWSDFPGGVGHRFHIHPKAVERHVFAELNCLGRYDRIIPQRNITAYLLNVNGTEDSGEVPVATAAAAAVPRESPPSSLNAAEPAEGTSDELSQEDLDLIEVLWKQDVDLGFTISNPCPKSEEVSPKTSEEDVEKLKVLESLKNWSSEASAFQLKEEPKNSEEEEEESDPWSGLDYTVDLETGEYILKNALDIKEEIARDLGIEDDLAADRESLGQDFARAPAEHGPQDLPSLEEALQLVGLEGNHQSVEEEKRRERRATHGEEEWEDEGHVSDDGDDMIQTHQFHPPHPPHPHPHPAHPRPFQGRMPYVRAMSMEQRWQDLANLLSLPGQEGGVHHPFAHHPHHHGAYGYHDNRSVLLHNATLAPPVGDLNSPGPYGPATMGSANLGSAVATSMNLTNSSEPIADGGTVFKLETPHDLLYYQNQTSEINQTTEGLLSSILNDEDLQLMDMAMTEGMYPMRLLESNSSNNASGPPPTTQHPEERLDASSDSAVSSMGSERVPSLSDGEWMETGSDSGHNGDHYNHIDYHSSKFRPFDYSYTGRQLLGAAGPSAAADPHMPPVAQKKHHMFGKRYFQEQSSSSNSSLVNTRGLGPPAPSAIKYEYSGEAGAEAVVPPSFIGPMDASPAKMSEAKYSCSIDFIRQQPGGRTLDQINHNHSYALPSDSLAMVRPAHRDKSRSRKAEEEHLSRDEKRAASMSIPLTVDDIVNLPMDEFNERLSKFDLSEAQLSLIRDIRRRGKNKVAAQNCRKRKLDQIISLADEVKQMRDRKHRLLRERDFMLSERMRVKEKFSQLYRHVFQALRDPDGNQYSPYEYSLQQSADGTVVLVPRSSSNLLDDTRKHKDPDSKE